MMSGGGYTTIDNQKVSGSVPAVSGPDHVAVKFTESNLNTFPPSEAKGKITGVFKPPSDADDTFSKPADGISEDTQTGWMRKFMVSAYKPYFDVDTSDVLDRIKESLFPFKVGVVSGYDLLALNSISGCRITDKSIFPEVDSTWKKFNEIQKLSSKTNGRTVGEMMTSAPLVVREKSNLESAARLLLETKYRRLPVVDSAGKLIGIITRGNIVRAALQLKQAKARRT